MNKEKNKLLKERDKLASKLILELVNFKRTLNDGINNGKK